MVIAHNTILSRSKDILANQVGNDTVMMSIEKGKYFGANKTGSYIWQLLENPMSFGELCDKLAAEFDLTVDKAVCDVSPFIQQMTEEKILITQ
jgi:hypothetical protein